MNSPAPSEAQQRERIATTIYPTADEAAACLGGRIAELIRSNEARSKRTVLGLATGSTPVRLYRELVRLHRESGLSFRKVITFNLDEYYGLSRDHPESYWRFMHEQLFAHIDISPENIHVPDGTLPRGKIFAACRQYEQSIADAGGIDLQILGIGRTGHIGFNEPGSTRESRTRLVTLDRLTRRDAARDFLGEANVPRHAITMGVGTILAAQEVVLLAWGAAKADVVARAIEAEPSESLPASFLQCHPKVSFLVDAAAASALSRCKYPWLVGPVQWTPPLVHRAVVWLALKAGKPVLKLLDEDYSEHGMADLLTEQGPAYPLNIRIFNHLQHTITGWPGGKPDADDTHRPEQAQPAHKCVIVFSPEPSHDVLGMGGTLRRLVEQGHNVHVVYLTSGNLAVPDEEAAIATDLVANVAHAFGVDGPVDTYAANVRDQLARKSAFGNDSTEVRLLKGLLRRSEAHAALRVAGVPNDHIRFLDLAFYELGRYRQFVPTANDVNAVAAVLRELAPHRIYATGHHDDPSSLPAVCFEILCRAWDAESAQPWRRECRGWLYRSSDCNWDASDVDMAVPLSPSELARKVQAIYQHKSQRSQSAGTEAGLREPWQQAEQQNRALSEIYDRLGLANYEAMEAFERFPLQETRS